jgi:hypothetical protein
LWQRIVNKRNFIGFRNNIDCKLHIAVFPIGNELYLKSTKARGKATGVESKLMSALEYGAIFRLQANGGYDESLATSDLMQVLAVLETPNGAFALVDCRPVTKRHVITYSQNDVEDILARNMLSIGADYFGILFIFSFLLFHLFNIYFYNNNSYLHYFPSDSFRKPIFLAWPNINLLYQTKSLSDKIFVLLLERVDHFLLTITLLA